PRTAGNPGPFDPRTPLDRPGSEDTERVTARPPESEGREASGAGTEETAFRPAGHGTVGAQRSAPDARRDGDPRGAVPAEPAHRPATPAASDARGVGAGETAFRPAGNGTVGAQRSAPDGESRGTAPAEPAHRPPASDARRAAAEETAYRPTDGTAEQPYRPTGDGPAASDARRTGAVPAEPTYRPAGDDIPDRKVAAPRFP
ncbi:hypothetical protein IGB19_36285, partial [Streptomyces sp. AC04842]|nr:hypothetical protein [Streptomyces sp. AC04842]